MIEGLAFAATGGRAMRQILPRLALTMVAFVLLAVVPSRARAFEYEHRYCYNFLAPDGTCPPYGTSEYAHLELNEASDPAEGRATCVDEYLTGVGYTSSKCVYYFSEGWATEYPGGAYGYPRAWNAGKVEHLVAAYERGYHTK